MRGIIYRMDTVRKGFVFIKGEDQFTRFAHIRDFEDPLDFDTLVLNQEVTFTPVNGSGKGNGLRATGVKLASSRDT